MRPDTPIRFWAKVDARGPDECWPWKGLTIPPDGYGRTSLACRRGTSTSAHRVAWYLTYGYWPSVCRHTCDNPPCCNVRHLRDGTQSDNVRDSVSKGRARRAPPRGEDSPMHKLTMIQVVAIRTEYAEGGVTLMALARRYGVGYTTIWHVIARGSWNWILI